MLGKLIFIMTQLQVTLLEQERKWVNPTDHNLRNNTDFSLTYFCVLLINQGQISNNKSKLITCNDVFIGFYSVVLSKINILLSKNTRSQLFKLYFTLKDSYRDCNYPRPFATTIKSSLTTELLLPTIN